jgi:hypothetical protein
MNARLLMLPIFVAGWMLVGCDDRPAATPDPQTTANSSEAKAEADKAAADAKAKAEKAAANAKADAEKAAADAKAKSEKVAADAKADADKAVADAKTAAIKAAAEAGKEQAEKLLSNLGTAVKDQKWTDAEAIIKQLDALRDKLSAEQQASYDSLKKQYADNKR